MLPSPYRPVLVLSTVPLLLALSCYVFFWRKKRTRLHSVSEADMAETEPTIYVEHEKQHSPDLIDRIKLSQEFLSADIKQLNMINTQMTAYQSFGLQQSVFENDEIQSASDEEVNSVTDILLGSDGEHDGLTSRSSISSPRLSSSSPNWTSGGRNDFCKETIENSIEQCEETKKAVVNDPVEVPQPENSPVSDPDPGFIEYVKTNDQKERILLSKRERRNQKKREKSENHKNVPASANELINFRTSSPSFGHRGPKKSNDRPRSNLSENRSNSTSSSAENGVSCYPISAPQLKLPEPLPISAPTENVLQENNANGGAIKRRPSIQELVISAGVILDIRDMVPLGLKPSQVQLWSTAYYHIDDNYVGRFFGKHKEYLKKIYDNTNVEIQVVKDSNFRVSKERCVLSFVGPDRHSLKRALQMMESRLRPIPSLAYEYLPYSQDSLSSDNSVNGSHVFHLTKICSPSHFFIVRATKFDHRMLRRIITKYYESTTTDVRKMGRLAIIGAVCAARFRNCWFRSMIVGINADQNRAFLKALDDGFCFEAELSSLKMLHSSMWYPFRAIECYLDGVAPPNGQFAYSSEALTCIKDFAKSPLLQFAIELVGIDDAARIVNVHMISQLDMTPISRSLAVELAVRQYVSYHPTVVYPVTFDINIEEQTTESMFTDSPEFNPAASVIPTELDQNTDLSWAEAPEFIPAASLITTEEEQGTETTSSPASPDVVPCDVVFQNWPALLIDYYKFVKGPDDYLLQ